MNQSKKSEDHYWLEDDKKPLFCSSITLRLESYSKIENDSLVCDSFGQISDFVIRRECHDNHCTLPTGNRTQVMIS